MSDGIRAVAAIREATGVPRTKIRPASARPAARPLSAHVVNRNKPGGLRPVSAHVGKGKPGGGVAQEGASVIASALREITTREKRLPVPPGGAAPPGGSRPPSARPPSGARRAQPVFIPTRSTSTSPRKPLSPRREIMRTLSATRAGLEETVTRDAATEALLLRVFRAKCLDLRLKPTEERRERFFELVSKNSTAGMLSLRETGLGTLAGAAVAALLLEKPIFHGLDLAGNMLRDLGTTAVAEMMRGDAHISHLDLRSNDIGPEGGGALFRAIRANTTLTELDLGILAGGNRNRVGGKAASVMREALEANTSLVSLSLFGNGLGAEGAHSFALGLQANTILKNLDLGLNSLRDDGMCVIAPALEHGALETLNLCNNAIDSRGIRRLASVLSSGRLLLQTLNLSDNSMSPRAATALGDALASNSLLCTLHLDRNELGADGAVALAAGLNSASLSLLTLSCNNIHDRGVVQISRELKRNTALTRLDLSTNQIGDSGATAVGQMLGWNTSLTSLSLEDNAVGDPGGVIVCNALFQNDSLRQLSLRGNKLHDVTGAAMVAGLRGNTGLTELDISWNDINYSNFRSIEKLISEHAAQYKEGAVPRLKKELMRLRKEEPKLAVREAELVEVTEERDRYLAEARRLNEEMRETLTYTELKLEESNQNLSEASADLDVRTAELKALTDNFAAVEKARNKEVGALQSRADRGETELARMRNELNGIRASTAKEEEEEEEIVAKLAEEEGACELEIEALREALGAMRDQRAMLEQQQAADQAKDVQAQEPAPAASGGGKPPLPGDKAKGAAGAAGARTGTDSDRAAAKGGDTPKGALGANRPTSAKGSRPSSAKERPGSAKERPGSAKPPSRVNQGPGGKDGKPPAK